MGRADLHIHSFYSFDGTASVREVLRSAARARLDVIAITDHNDIRGGLEARSLAGEFGLQVIPGAEISTREGHLVVLFIEQAIPAKLSLVETLLKVGEQGGVGIAAHPGHPVPNSLSRQAILAALEHPLARTFLRGVEVCNMNPTHSFFNKRSKQAAASLPLAQIASSDAHLADMVGAGLTHFDGHTPTDLRRALEACSTVPEQVNREWPLLVFLRWARLYKRKIKRRPDSGQDLNPFSRQPAADR